MCLVLIRYKTTTKVFVINNLDFGSISTGVGLSILISNLSKKRGFFADFFFYQLSLVCFYHLHIRECVHIYFFMRSPEADAVPPAAISSSEIGRR